MKKYIFIFLVGIGSIIFSMQLFAEDEIRLSVSNTSPRPGETITFTISTSMKTALFFVRKINDSKFGRTMGVFEASPPYQWTTTLPIAAASIRRYTVSGRNINGETVKSNEIVIVTKPDLTTLEQLTFRDGDRLYMREGSSKPVDVVGLFSDGFKRNLTQYQFETVYSENIIDGLKVTPGDSPVIDISPDGVVTGLQPGEAEVVATNNGKTAIRRVKVVVDKSRPNSQPPIITPPPTNIPPATLTTSPTTPTSKDTITVTASGEWNNGCAPTSMTLDSISGNTTRLRLNPDFSSSDICLQVITPWSISTNVGTLPQGTHTLEAFRVIDNTDQVLGTSSISVQQPPVVVEPPPPTTEPPAVSTQSFTSTMVAMHSDKCLDIDANSKKDGANAHQFRCHGNDNQSFVFTPVDGKDDVYTITAKHSGKCLDVEGVSLNAGASILQWSCGSNTPNQQFTLKSVGTKVFQIKPVHSGQCLDVFGNKTTDNANVIQWTCKENKPNQQWQVNGYR